MTNEEFTYEMALKDLHDIERGKSSFTSSYMTFKRAYEALERMNRSCDNCAYMQTGCKVGNFLLEEDLNADDFCCKDWYSKYDE